MKLHLFFLLMAFCVSWNCLSQDTNDISSLREDRINTSIESKIGRFLADNVEREFVTKHMAANDSLEFPIHIEVDKFGNVLPAKTDVATKYDFFNIYFETWLGKLPTFDAKNFFFDETLYFKVTPDFKLEPLQITTEREPLKVATPATFPGCENLETPSELKRCFVQKLHEFLAKEFRTPAKAREGRLIVMFTIAESGEIKDVKVVRDTGAGTAQEAIRAFGKLPRMIPAKDEFGNPMPSTNSLPILIGNR